MKTMKEYHVSKSKVGDSIFYFFENDYILVENTFISFKRKKLVDIPIIKEDLEIFKQRLDYIVDNNLTIKL